MLQAYMHICHAPGRHICYMYALGYALGCALGCALGYALGYTPGMYAPGIYALGFAPCFASGYTPGFVLGFGPCYAMSLEVASTRTQPWPLFVTWNWPVREKKRRAEVMS